MRVFTFLNEVIFSSLEGLIILIIFSLLSYNKKYISHNNIKSILFILFYTFFSLLTTLSLPIIWHTIVLLFFTIFILAFFTSTKFFVSFVFTLISAVYFFATEYFILIIVSAVLRIKIDYIINDPTIRFQIGLVAKTFQLGLLGLLYKFRFPFIKKVAYDHENYLYYNIIGIFLIALSISCINHVSNIEANLVLYKILLFLVFMIYLIVGFIDSKEKNELVQDRNRLKLEKEYVNNLENTITIIRREKHDFANHINTIYAMCILNKPHTIERIRNYLEKISNNLKASYNFFETGNDYIDGLLAVKSNFTYENDILLDVDFEAPLSHLKIEDNDLVGVISNVVDNAFEAVLSNRDKDYNIVSISSYIENGQYYISISNNGPQIVPDLIDKIFENGFSTKETGTEKNHGYGLYTVKRLINKYNGRIEVYSTKEETEFLISLPIENHKIIKKISG